MPDCTLVTDQDWTIRAPEVLFDPYDCAQLRELSVPQLVQATLFQGCLDECASPYDQVNLFSNMVLVGHGSMLFRHAAPPFGNGSDRLASEIAKLAPPLLLQQTESQRPLRVHATPERHMATWIGGSIKASLSTFGGSIGCITREKYSDVGPRVVHQMCPD